METNTDHCHECETKDQERATAENTQYSLDRCADVCVSCAGWEEDDVKDLVIKAKAFLVDYIAFRHSDLTKARLPKGPL